MLYDFSLGGKPFFLPFKVYSFTKTDNISVFYHKLSVILAETKGIKGAFLLKKGEKM